MDNKDAEIIKLNKELDEALKDKKIRELKEKIAATKHMPIVIPMTVGSYPFTHTAK